MLSRHAVHAVPGKDWEGIACWAPHAVLRRRAVHAVPCRLHAVLGKDWETIVREERIFGPHRPPPALDDPLNEIQG